MCNDVALLKKGPHFLATHLHVLKPSPAAHAGTLHLTHKPGAVLMHADHMSLLLVHSTSQLHLPSRSHTSAHKASDVPEAELHALSNHCCQLVILGYRLNLCKGLKAAYLAAEAFLSPIADSGH